MKNISPPLSLVDKLIVSKFTTLHQFGFGFGWTKKRTKERYVVVSGGR